MPKDIFMTKYLQGDKNAAFIIYVANSVRDWKERNDILKCISFALLFEEVK